MYYGLYYGHVQVGVACNDIYDVIDIIPKAVIKELVLRPHSKSDYMEFFKETIGYTYTVKVGGDE